MQETKDEPQIYECKICSLLFANKRNFESHMKVEHEKRLPPAGVY